MDMKLTIKQIMLILMSTLLVLVVVMGSIVFGRVNDLLQLSAGPGSNTSANEDPAGTASSGPDIPASSSTSDSASGETTVPHEHEYTIRETLAATCDNYGYTIYYCECGKADAESMITTSPLGHNFGATTVVAATCEHDGWTERTCSRCNYTEKTNPTTADHQFGPWAETTGTVDAPINEQRTCSTCKTTEIRSLDTSETWVVRRSTLDPVGTFTHYRIVLDLADSETAPAYEIYVGLNSKTLEFDYDDTGLVIFYSVNDSVMNYSVPSEATVITIDSDGSVTLDKPVDEPDPDIPDTTDPDIPDTTDPDIPETTGPNVPGITEPSNPETTGPNTPETTEPVSDPNT